MSGISTHILDTSTGRPAAGVAVSLFQEDRQIGSGISNADGRCPDLLSEVSAGTYRIVFEITSYFADSFYPEVSVTFIVRDPAARYHIPLLISPFGYTTYRGS